MVLYPRFAKTSSHAQENTRIRPASLACECGAGVPRNVVAGKDEGSGAPRDASAQPTTSAGRHGGGAERAERCGDEQLATDAANAAHARPFGRRALSLFPSARLACWRVRRVGLHGTPHEPQVAIQSSWRPI